MKLQEVKMWRGGCRFGIDDSGQALVEVAISAIFLMGTCECGILEYDAIEVASAARAGVQYGAQSRTTAVDISGIQTAALSDGSNVSGLKATATHFCSCSDGSASTCSGGDCTASRVVEYVQVNTAVTVTPPFRIPALPQSFTLTGLAVMRVGQ
jgi:hypothetical protein